MSSIGNQCCRLFYEGDMVTTSGSFYRQCRSSRGTNLRAHSSQGSNTTSNEPTSLSLACKGAKTLFDFTRSDCAKDWTEYSDTGKVGGTSKATLIALKTLNFQRAILFTLYNPRSQGGGFAGVRCGASFNLVDHASIVVKCRGQGVNRRYKMLLRHRGQDKGTPVYGQIFLAPENEFDCVRLPLTDFKPYHRGKELSSEIYPLDLSAITSITLKVDNGPYLPENRPGPSTLEIDWIKASK